MPQMLSPGVFTTEINASAIVPTVSNSIGVFGGDFVKGPVGEYTLLTSISDLLTFYGQPTNSNYNDFYQAYNFLQYGNKLLLSRASNVNGIGTPVTTAAGLTVTVPTATLAATPTNAVIVSDAASFAIGSLVAFDSATAVPASVDLTAQYVVVATDLVTNTLTLDRNIVNDVPALSTVYLPQRSMNAVFETTSNAVIAGLTISGFGLTNDILTVTNAALVTIGQSIQLGNTTTNYSVSAVDTVANTITLTSVVLAADVTALNAQILVAPAPIYTKAIQPTSAQLFSTLMNIENPADFDMKYPSIAFSQPSSKLKIISKNPGAWGNDLEICIATPSAFGTVIPSTAFTGVPLDGLFEYAPTQGSTEFGIIIREQSTGTIVEQWLVDMDPLAKDQNNKSLFVEDVINLQSSYIFIKANAANAAPLTNDCATVNGVATGTILLSNGSDSPIQGDDLLNAYDIFSNKEALDIDIVIANELDGGVSCKSIVDARMDCIGFIGANYADVVGQKSALAVANLINWRKVGALNFNDMFLVAVANYKYQYDRYNDKYRWVNLAGDIAGLRAQTNTSRASWWASAGLERGQIKNVTKIGFNPTAGQRDQLLYTY